MLEDLNRPPYLSDDDCVDQESSEYQIMSHNESSTEDGHADGASSDEATDTESQSGE